MKFDLITPKKQVFSEEIDSVTIPTTSGEVTILPHHIDLLSRVSAGEIIARTKNKNYSFAITGGILQVSKDTVSVLGDYAIRAEDIEVSKAEAAQRRAQEALARRDTDEQFADANAALTRSLLELKVAKRHHRRNSSGQ